MNEITLGGCSPTPLASYLKALGVLRLLSAKYPEIRGFWSDERFVLRTKLDREAIEYFFLEEYEPTALVTPWNGRGGFLEGDDEDGEESSRAGAQMVRAFSSKTVANRFHPLARILRSISDINVVGNLNIARAELKRLKVNEKTKGKDNLSDDEKNAISRQDALVKTIKGHLLQELRNSLPDDVLSWFDTCLALVTDPSTGGKKSAPSPLLGAGGLDGSMDFGVNYLKRINDVFEPGTGRPRESAREWLNNALWGELTGSLYSVSAQDKKKVSVGQFSPSDAGGYNAENGFSGEALLNPWNTILQLEGATLFAASTVRRLEGDGDIYSSLPFTVAPVAIGETVALSDEVPKGAKRRTAEMWLPLWSRPTTCRELEGVLREGRMTLHGHSVTKGFDCVRAVTSLGSSRGIEQFQRFVFLKRSGDAFFALDKGRFSVRSSAYSNLVEELEGSDHFLSKLHTFVRSKTNSGEWKASARLRSMAKRLDNLLVHALQRDDKRALLEALILLGEIQSSIASGTAARQEVPPVPRLSELWVQKVDDGTPAYRIACALAGMRSGDKLPLPLRAQLFPVHPDLPRWKSDTDKDKDLNDDQYKGIRLHTSTSGSLPHMLRNLLDRRLFLAEKLEMKDKPLDSQAGAMLDDVAGFLQNDRIDRRVAALLPGLSLCDVPREDDRSSGDGSLPPAFALLKLCFTPDSILRNLQVLEQDGHVPVPPGIITKLASGYDPDRVVLTAWRRLHASGLNPVFSPDTLPSLGGLSPQRVAAALLIPLRYGAYGRLVRSVLKISNDSADSAGNPAAWHL
jgi:CRISPR-associated protein Csx17